MKTLSQIFFSYKTIKWVALVLLTFLPLLGQAQLKLGDNAQNVNPNAIFELESTDKGILIPRMTTTDRDAAFTSNVPNGLLIYNTTENCFQSFLSSDGVWNCIGGGALDKLVLNGTVLEIAEDNSVDLASLANTDAQTLTLSRTTLIISGGNSVDLEQFNDYDRQNLTLSSTILEISNGNSVDLVQLSNSAIQALFFATSSSTTQAELEIENANTLSLIASGTLSLVNTDSSTLTLVSTATHGQLIQVSEGANTGYRLLAADPLYHGDIGNNAVDLSTQNGPGILRGATGNYSFAAGLETTAQGDYSTAFGQRAFAAGIASIASGHSVSAVGHYSTVFGYGTTASGSYSFAAGLNNTAIGNSSTAFGDGTTAEGYSSTAFGEGTTASGSSSFAAGNGTTASGRHSFAAGNGTTAESYGQTTIGHYNTPHPAGAAAGSTVGTDRLFVIGNGSSSGSRSDALVVLKNGTTTINGPLTINTSSSTASYALDIDGNANITGEIYQSGTVTFTHPDYVFESFFDGVSEYNKTYRMPSLEEVERFVRNNKHLPGVQSRADIQKSGSWNVSKNIQSNLEKVEELFLHTIEQEKQIKALEQSNKAYQEKLQRQEDLLLKLAQRLEALEEKE